jgi:hypothetical protein
MILSLIAVGEKYVKNCEPYIANFIDNGWEVNILTDSPEYFKLGTIEYYDHKIFSYFHKLLYPLKLAEKHKDDIVYVDADWIQNLDLGFPRTFTKSNDFLYYGNWPYGKTFSSYKNDPYFDILIKYWDKIEYNYQNLTTILEWIYHLPYNDNIGQIIKDIESIKPVFEYTSLTTDTGYSGIGNGEGLALSYALDKNNISINTFNKKHFKL